MSESKATTEALEEDLLTSHNYDGIQEYDNPMPGWWVWSFVATVVWAGVYFVGINLDLLPDYDATLAAEMAEQHELEAKFATTAPVITPEVLAAAAADPARVEVGAGVYTMNCAACHGQKGEGLIGPNLTDTAWLYGPELVDIEKIIAEGTAKGMPGWSAILVPDDLVSVVAYVHSLRGTNPPNAKEAQGTDYGEQAPDGADSATPEPAAEVEKTNG